MVSPNWVTSFVSCLIKCNTKRSAVFLPIPGSLANSLTAFSKSVEEKTIVRNYERKRGIIKTQNPKNNAQWEKLFKSNALDFGYWFLDIYNCISRSLSQSALMLSILSNEIT